MIDEIEGSDAPEYSAPAGLRLIDHILIFIDRDPHGFDMQSPTIINPTRGCAPESS